jgi:hypothetical protein
VGESVGFSPSRDEAVDFGDFEEAQKFVDTINLEPEIPKESRKSFLGGGANRLDLRSRAVFLALANLAEDRRGRSTETGR